MSTFTGRVQHGHDNFQGTVMTRNLVNQQQLNSSLQAMASKIADDFGNRLAERLAKHGAKSAPSKPEPVKFKDGTPLASDLTEAEARALGDNLPLIGEYVNDIETFRSLGISFESFAEDKLLNERTDDRKLTAELFNAITKQSREFTNKHMGIT